VGNLVELGAGVCDEHGDGLGVEAPVVTLLRTVLVRVVHQPALLQDLRPDPLRLKKSKIKLQNSKKKGCILLVRTWMTHRMYQRK
jgi:hypothetical protein